MFLHRVQRRRLVTLLVGVLLLTQWLVAAHACLPLHAAVSVPDATQVPVVSVHCHEAELDDAADLAHGIGARVHPSGLCQAHCTADGQVPAAAAPADLPAPALGWCLVHAPLDVSPAAAMAVASRAAPVRAGAPPGWPPLYLLNGVLRN